MPSGAELRKQHQGRSRLYYRSMLTWLLLASPSCLHRSPSQRSVPSLPRSCFSCSQLALTYGLNSTSPTPCATRPGIWLLKAHPTTFSVYAFACCIPLAVSNEQASCASKYCSSHYPSSNSRITSSSHDLGSAHVFTPKLLKLNDLFVYDCCL
jgi:hypothetical protein